MKERISKFVAKFMLFQMVLAVFTPVSVFAADLWSIEELFVKNLADGTQVELTEGSEIDLSDYEYGELNILAEFSGPGGSGKCIRFEMGGQSHDREDEPYSFNPGIMPGGSNTLNVSLFAGVCDSASLKDTKSVTFSVVGSYAEGDDDENGEEEVEVPTGQIEYNPKTPTTQEVVATLITTPSEGVTVTNNEGSFKYVFSENGEFTFEFENEAGSGSETAIVDWIKDPLEAPTLISPPDDAVVSGKVLTNNWSDVDGADYYAYQSCHDADCTNQRFWGEYEESQKTAYNVGDAVFWWRVKAVSDYDESDWSEIWKVTVDNSVPATPTNLKRRTPSGDKTYECGEVVKRQTLIPIWDENTEPNFSHYEYTSFNAPDGSIGRDEEKLYENEFVHSWTPPIDGTYGFSVRAVGENGKKSPWALTDKTIEGSCQIIYDSESPTSFVNDLPPYINTEEFDITVTAEDNQAVDYVELFYRKDGGEWMKYANGAAETASVADTAYILSDKFDPNKAIVFDTFLTTGDGFYEFYSIATDTAGNKEEKPGNGNGPEAEAETTVWTTSPPVTCSGENPLYLSLGEEYDPETFSCSSDREGVEEEVDGEVDENVPGDYEISHVFTDPAGNIRIISRTVVVFYDPESENGVDDEEEERTPADDEGRVAPPGREPAALPTGGPEAGGAIAFAEALAEEAEEDILGEVDEEAEDEEDGEVVGEVDEEDEAEDDVAKSCFMILGICWYWWLLVVLLALGGWYLFSRRKKDESQK